MKKLILIVTTMMLLPVALSALYIWPLHTGSRLPIYVNAEGCGETLDLIPGTTQNVQVGWFNDLNVNIIDSGISRRRAVTINLCGQQFEIPYYLRCHPDYVSVGSFATDYYDFYVPEGIPEEHLFYFYFITWTARGDEIYSFMTSGIISDY